MTALAMKQTLRSPMSGDEMILCSEPRTLTIRGLEVDILYWFYRDTDGVQYTETSTDELNLTQIHEQLFTRYGVPRPVSIV